jgi:hypothetical protein
MPETNGPVLLVMCNETVPDILGQVPQGRRAIGNLPTDV